MSTCRPPRSRWRRALLRLAQLTALLLGITVVAIVSMRFARPPTSSMILQARFAAWRAGALAPEQRWVAWSEISPHAGLAVVAAEDQRFPEHFGFDAGAVAKAWEEGRDGGRQRGASTITQQVAKNLFLWPGRSYLRKGLEAGLTLLLEAFWPKRRILEVYLNVAEMGEGVYGIEAASRRYFGKPAAGLTREEAALLAAVLPSPRRLRVDRPSAYVRARQAWILKQMKQLGGPDSLGLDPG